MCVSVPALKVDNPNRKCAAASVTSKELLSDGTSCPFKPQTETVPAQPAASHTVHRVHRPSDMNRGYNLLAFPHGGYLIREKEGGVDTGEDNGPSEAPGRGERAGGA